MKKLPDDKSYPCIFKIIKAPHQESWAYGKTGEYYQGIYASHHSEDRNIFLAQKHLISRGSEPENGWIDSDKVKVIGWTEEIPANEFRRGLIEA